MATDRRVVVLVAMAKGESGASTKVLLRVDGAKRLSAEGIVAALVSRKETFPVGPGLTTSPTPATVPVRV